MKTVLKDHYLNKQDVMKITGKKDTWAINRIKLLNDELKEQGYLINPGCIPASYFYKRMGLEFDD